VDSALDSYLKAISLNPANAMYWLGLATVYESKGDFEAAGSALDRALYLNPTYAKSRWMLVNQLLKEGGAAEDIVFELGRIIKDFPDERKRAFSVLHRITGDDVFLIIENAIPKDLESMVDYLDFLISRKLGVEVLWNAISSGAEIDQELASKYINFLVLNGEILKARSYWTKYMGLEEDFNNIILNSGFEDDLCGNRLCWRVDSVNGAHAGIDDAVFFEGRRSLKIEFDGSANVDFHHVFMPVPLEPGSTYTLTTFIKTEGLSTTNGFFLEVYGLQGCKFIARTEKLSGTNPWQELSVDFTSPTECRTAGVRLRRLGSRKLDNRIRGSVWVDGVRLVNRGVPTERATSEVEAAR
jgi:hypothetical protein